MLKTKTRQDRTASVARYRTFRVDSPNRVSVKAEKSQNAGGASGHRGSV